MNGVSMALRVATLAPAALLLLSPLPAMPQDAQTAQSAVRDALALGQQRQFSAAVDQLNRALVGCTAAADGTECEKLVLYSLGYVHQVEAGRSTPEAPALMSRAARYYQEVVNADPGYQDAVYNLSLVLRELGPQEWQEPYYRAAPERDPRRRTQHLVFLGDYYAARERWQDAARAYEAALTDDPGARAAAAGLVAVAGSAPPGMAVRLMEHTPAWEPAMPDMAVEAYRTALRTLPGDERAMAERAFLRLAVLTGGQVELDPGAAPAPLPGAAEELDAFVSGPWRPVPADSWWMQSEDRRRALAEIALRAGTRWVSEGRPDRAQQCWSAVNDYVGQTSREALDLKRELALLYFRHDDLDPTGERFRDLEHELFLEKAAVLRTADHAAAQRYHTALGLIYAERGEWTGPRARNAVDQLTWALQKADLVDAETGAHRPLPEIRTLLASGLEETGDAAAARSLHFRAALGYLDTDALREAAGALERAGETPRTGPLRALIAARDRLDGRAAETRPAEVDAACERRAIDTATESAAAAGDESFAARQRFKLLGDCARHLPADRATAYDAEAFDLVVQQRVPLVGTGDLRRFQHARASVVEAAGLPTTARGLRYDAGDGRPDGVAIALPGEARPAFLPVPEEQALAAKVVRLLAPGTDRLRLRLEDGVVQMDSAQAGRIPAAVMEELSRVEGVKAVRVAPVRPRGGS